MDNNAVSQRCRYAYSNCHRRRAVKKDGHLHALCDFHREKANACQKKYAAKRQSSQQSKEDDQLDSAFHDPELLEPMPLQSDPVAFSEDDRELLGHIMSS
ncbi:hypothetical protein DYB37_006432 [Aphanomyces astaci]|uniref:Uncharacterized protein n=1 Tax=Aphanomyces astaci TaxID=112090 RepID=A0A418D6U7_APHAT|nr:hypothetical protein DYB35_005252 [Aphanomyces astaci]RHZ05186.1 hypothetical protein DYB37_006432 [Aphanomyces astaci]